MRLLLLLAVTAALPSAFAQPSSWQHQFGGYYKALLTTSRSFFTNESYADVMNRLRLSYDGRQGEWFQVHVDFDNEAHFGNYITQPEYQLVRERQKAAWFDLHHIYADTEHAYWDTSLYRGYVTVRRGPAAVTVGRQRIGWGTAKFWSPADVFNPLNPLQIEMQERQGVDGAQLEWVLPRNFIWTAVHLPQSAFNRSTTATRLATNWHGYDLAAFAGRFARDWMSGAEFAGQWGGAGLRGEITCRWREQSRPEDNALRVTFGSDYAFANTLYLVGEYFYNQGQPSLEDSFDPAVLFQFTNEIFTLNRHFFSGGIGYDITPLFRLEAYTVVDAAGGSAFFMPQAKYNLTPNTDVTIGGQLFASPAGGEFDGLSNSLFVELMVHF